MSALHEVIQKIRVGHAAPPAEFTTLAATLPADDPVNDRLTYAGFPTAIKDAMKIAAQRWNWDRETWRYQTALVQDALRRVLADDLALAYRNPPPAFKGAA